MLKRFAFVYFVLSVAVIALLYGMVAADREWFPYNVYREAYMAYQAYKLRELEKKRDLKFIQADKSNMQPLATEHVKGLQDQLFLVSGGFDRYATEKEEDGSIAWLMNRKGEVLHRWPLTEDYWGNPDHLVPAERESVYPCGLHMFENGDLLVSFQGTATHPFAAGLARFDKRGKLIWEKKDFVHHWLGMREEESSFYVTSLHLATSPVHIAPDSFYEWRSETGSVYLDCIQLRDAKGDVLKEWDMRKVLDNSNLRGLAAGGSSDPLHLNFVHELSRTDASAYPMFKKGDLLFSLRDKNMIGVLDPEGEVLKWSHVGAGILQHSPIFDGNGGILLFDNQGGDLKEGGSRIVRVDVKSDKCEVLFPKEPLPFDFLTDTAGYIELHPDGKRLLITLTVVGRLLEIDLEGKQLLWSYSNTHPLPDHPKITHGRLPMHQASYIQEALFLSEKQ